MYVGNLAKTVTKEMLENLFSEIGKVVSAKVSSEEDVEAAILALNKSVSFHPCKTYSSM